jgi:hypoxanthine-guanine phosphoribosyltransferase
VLVVEDIIDTGLTLSYLVRNLVSRAGQLEGHDRLPET